MAVFVSRQSPDWIGLASDYARGDSIDAARYCPPSTIPGFPADIGSHIARWNAWMRVDFFTCRARLKQIAAWTLEQPGTRRLSFEAAQRERAEVGDDVVFFHDDDDWFAPDLAGALAYLPTADIYVFPLIRLATETFTFVRGNESARNHLGPRRNFDFRYQSNNYGIAGRRCDRATLRGMKDHVQASSYVSWRGLQDLYVDRIIGATVKTPCSASILPGIVANRESAQGQVCCYVAALRRLAVPTEFCWLTDGITALVALFSRCTGRCG